MTADLGDLLALAKAIGLVDGNGNAVPRWFEDPGHHLSSVLSNSVQRNALVAFVDDLLGGSDAVTDEDGMSWLPVVEVDGGAFRLFVTLLPDGDEVVRVGVGARVRAEAETVGCEVDVHVPLFLASGTTHVLDPVLLGKPGAAVDVSLRVTLPPATAPGGVSLESASLTARIPTTSPGDAAVVPAEEPSVGLALRGLQMPGAAQPRDVVVDAAHLGELDDALLELVLGLVEAQVQALPGTSPLAGLAAMLGLADDRVPDFPVADLAARGPVALADWLARALTGAAREDWVAGLADLLGGSVATDGAVTVPLGAAEVRLELLVTPGASGRPVVVPRVEAGVAGGDAGGLGVRLALAADLVALDLGSGSAVALPRLRLVARVAPATGDLLPATTGPGGVTVRVGALEAGLGLDADRRPVLVLQAEDAEVAGTTYPVLDLSTPEALAEVAANAVAGVAADLLATLGPAGTAVAVLLGLEAPAGVAGVPLLDPGELLRDPVGAVRARWQALAAAAPAKVRSVLEAARDAFADDRVRSRVVSGEGTAGSPWLLPLAPEVDLRLVADGDALTVGVVGAARLPDLAGTGAVVGLDLRIDLVELDLAGGTAGFLPGVDTRLALSGPDGAPLHLGAETITLTTESLGAGLAWSAGTGVRMWPVLTGARLRFGSTEVGLPELVLDDAGRLALDDLGWNALEAALAAVATDLAERRDWPWLADLVGILGWSAGAAPVGGAPRLSLAALVADPEEALRDHVAAVAGDEHVLRALLTALAGAVGAGALGGRGASARPWVVPLVGALPGVPGVPGLPGLPGLSAEDRPALSLALGELGAALAPGLPGDLRGWLPGEPGLEPSSLVAALSRVASLDDVLADVLAGRPDLALGLEDLVDRWVDTDGLVTLPADELPDGVEAHRPSELPHGAPLGGPDVDELLADLWETRFDSPPATLVYVAVGGQDRHGAPDVLTGATLDAVPGSRVLDLTAAATPPEAFVGPDPAAAAEPVWVVRLGTRAASRLPTGHPAGPDPDGVAGQAARLARVLAPIAAAGRDVVVVAHGGAGHPAARAVEGLPGVSGLVTIGTPWSPVTVDTLDALPAGESLRLLSTLLGLADRAAADPADTATDGDDPDDDDLALVRACVAALLDRDAYPDPLADLRLSGPLAAPTGVPVHAVVGALSAPALRRGLTAAVAAALAARGRMRALAAEAAAASDQLRLGAVVPIRVPAGAGGLTAEVRVGLDLAGLAVPEFGTTAGITGPALRVRLDLGAATGWLVAGPDAGRLSGGARPLACRRLSAEVVLPVPGWARPGVPAAAAGARLVLHDARAFGTATGRWVVDLGAAAPPDATPLLPEVRALLGEVTQRLSTAAAVDPVVAGLRDTLVGLGLLGPDGALDSVSLERLLLDPVGQASAMVAEAARRDRVAAGLRAVVGDDRADPGHTVLVRWGEDRVRALLDLAGRRATLSATGTGPLPWSVSVAAGPAGAGCTARIGADLAHDGSTDAAGVALLVETGAGIPRAPGTDGRDLPPVAVAVAHRLAGGSVVTTPLWPAPTPDALLDALTALLPGVLLGTALDAARTSLAGLAPAAATAVDAVLDAVGLLAPAGTAAGTAGGTATSPVLRPLRLPSALLADPARWLGSLSGGAAAALPALVDAVAGLLGAAGGPGALRIADGVLLRVRVDSGRVLAGVEVDGSEFTAPTGGPALLLGGGAFVALDWTAPASSPLPEVRLQVGVAGTGALHLRVGPADGGAGDGVGVGLVLAPTGRPEVVLLPGGPGLGALAETAGAAVLAALPELLDTLAALDPPAGTDPSAPKEVAGRLVARLGDALGLRDTTGRFDPTALAAFGADPAGALAARSAALLATGLALLAEAVEPLLDTAAGQGVVVADGAVAVSLGPVTVAWRPGTARVEGTVSLSGVPGLATVEGTVALDATGLAALDVAVGPAPLAAGAVDLAPYARIRTGGLPSSARSVEVGLGIGVSSTAEQRLVARWDLAAARFGLLVATPGPADVVESTAPREVALALVAAVLDLAGDVVLAVPAIDDALATDVLGTTPRDLLEGVLLDGATGRLDATLAAELAAPEELLRRLGRLATNLAGAPGAAVRIDDKLTLRLVSTPHAGDGSTLGLNLAVDGAWEINPGDDVVVSLEDDASWITPPTGSVQPGLSVGLLRLPAAGPPVAAPSLTVGGVGVRITRSDGPLLDAAVTVESVACYLFGAVAATEASTRVAGGLRLEIAGLGVPLAGASGGTNAVAQGVMPQAGSGQESPVPRFSPALAVQKHPGTDLMIGLTAGPGEGPWWLTVQREFGPIYLEQVGLAVVGDTSAIQSIGVLVDGRVDLLGLSASVDDLSLTYLVGSGRSALDPAAWQVDLAGFAVTADTGGIRLAGGLRKFTPAGGGVEYLGMLMARFSVYGLTVYGGYGVVGPDDDRYTSLFLFGAVNGPIGGPPAFFVTGIGGGFGINRRLVLPPDLSGFDDFPLIKALDPAARPGDPFEELALARGRFPAERGTYWFAAGLSFNSFALVDGVAVLAVQIGGGVEISLLGLARMALPRPEAALVSIEMALVARFSTREGVILVQAQLTDNSWLLAPEVRLTGGFAFASWFAGANRGQFVVTMGGYHPDFHRDGYPVVPRLGLAWRLGDAISIVGESYFALTSEALMAGTKVEVHAQLGPAWAHAVFGADGIIFFDPFWLDVTVYASIDAGVTIDVWIGEITISVHLAARLQVTGPPYHVVATFEVGPVGLTLEIGPASTEPEPLGWGRFVEKYLEAGTPGADGQPRARVLSAVTGNGAVTPAGAAADGGEHSPDGTRERPFRVAAEFDLTITSTVPLRGLDTGNGDEDLAADRVVSVAPMGLATPTRPVLGLTMVGPPGDAQDRIDRLDVRAQRLGSFPVGTWGIAQERSNAKVPSGDVISAADRVVLTGTAAVPEAGPDIEYRQVETGERRLNPLITEDANRRRAVRRATGRLAATVPTAEAGTVTDVAAGLLVERGGRSVADVAAWRADRAASPMLGYLGEGLGRATRPVSVELVDAPRPPDPEARRGPVVRAVFTAPQAATGFAAPVGGDPGTAAPRGTSVSPKILAALDAVRSVAPSLAAVESGLLAAVPARLLQAPASAAIAEGTVLATEAPPVTAQASIGAAVIASRTAGSDTVRRLADLEAALGSGATVAAGEVVVLELPDAARDVATDRPSLRLLDGRARVVALGPAGGWLADTVLDRRGDGLVVPPATRGLVVVGLSSEGGGLSRAAAAARLGAARPEVAGWTAVVPLPSATDGVLVAAGSVVDVVTRVPHRGIAPAGATWTLPGELVAGECSVATTFADPVCAVAVSLEGGARGDVAMGLTGARRPTDAAGAPEPPVLVTDGPRAVLVYRVVESTPGTTVTVKSGPRRRLDAVLGVVTGADRQPAGDPTERLAAAIARLGVAALVPPPAAPGPGQAELAWKEG